jgi:hypothetical protein
VIDIKDRINQAGKGWLFRNGCCDIRFMKIFVTSGGVELLMEKAE